MTSPIKQLPSDASFETVISSTQSLLAQMQEDNDSPEQLQNDIIHLLQLEKGPRGFFASFLTDSRDIVDNPPDYLLNAFTQVPEITAELLTKNLAMSSAMMVYHTRQKDPNSAAGSQQVQQRCVQLIHQLQLEAIQKELKKLVNSVQDRDSYSAFLKRWNYDDEQRSAIGQIAQQCLTAIAT